MKIRISCGLNIYEIRKKGTAMLRNQRKITKFSSNMRDSLVLALEFCLKVAIYLLFRKKIYFSYKDHFFAKI